MSLLQLRAYGDDIISPISKREKEVLHLIAHEYSNKQIAGKLFVSPYTVDSHRKNLLRKLKVTNAAGLVRRAFELNYLP